MKKIFASILLLFSPIAFAQTSNDAFIEALSIIMVEFDNDYFTFFIGTGMLGLAIGMGAGWSYRAVRTRW